METLFENEDFILKSTGHNYDFVGIIETKTDEPLTFFFDEEVDKNGDVIEDKTEFLEVWDGLKEYEDNDDGYDEAEEISFGLNSKNGHIDWFRTRDDKSTGFLSDCKERGMFLALIKAYCPEKLDCIAWA